MNLYEYVAINCPNTARAICHKYGYEIVNVKTAKDLGVCLKKVVAKEGEPALKDIVVNHPDKDLIIEICKNENFVGVDGSYSNQQECECKKCRSGNIEFYTGETAIKQSMASQSQTNTYLIASAFLLGIAIISTKL